MLINLIKEREKNKKIDKIIGGVYAFKYKNKQFSDITVSIQEQLRKEAD